MRAVKLKKRDLHKFLESLSNFGEFWGPVKKDDGHVLEKVDDFSQLDLKALRTRLPFKKLLFPSRMRMLSFNEGKLKEELEDIPRRVIFGMHPCDITGLMITDNFFNLQYSDPYYNERRKRVAIVGLSCEPDDKCFCKTTGTGNVERGFDLFLTELDKFFLIWVGSSLGDDLLRECPELIDEEVNHKDLVEYIDWRNRRDNMFTLDLNFTGMPGIMELSFDDNLWQELGEKCLSCGSCTIVCPTCPCFNVIDQIALNGKEGERIRQWDSCQYREYSMVAGGHNFRESRAERLRLRFIHKLQAFVGKFGEPACVGCGRCINTCPVGIDVKTVGLALKGEEVKA